MGAPQNRVVIQPMDQFLTTGEAARIVHVVPPTITRWCDAGKLGFIRTPGGHRRIRMGDLIALVEQKRR